MPGKIYGLPSSCHIDGLTPDPSFFSAARYRFFWHSTFPFSSVLQRYDPGCGCALFWLQCSNRTRARRRAAQVHRIAGGGRSFGAQSRALNLQICWNNLSSRYGWKTLSLYVVLCTHFIILGGILYLYAMN